MSRYEKYPAYKKATGVKRGFSGLLRYEGRRLESFHVNVRAVWLVLDISLAEMVVNTIHGMILH